MSQKIQFADKLRGLAALSVVVSHFAYGFWAYTDEVARLTASPPLRIAAPIADWQKAWLPEAFFGHFGVALFFLISGFVVPFALLNRSRAAFAKGRVLRIWPTYAVGLGVTVALVVASARYFDTPQPFSWTTVALQLLMIRDLFWVPSVDGIVWTLEIEAKFYLTCLLVAPTLRGGHSARLLVMGLSFAALAGVCSLSPQWLSSDAPTYRVLYALCLSAQMITFMLIGVVFNFHYRGLVSARRGFVLSSAFFAAVLLQWSLGPIRSSLIAGGVSYGLALVVFTSAYLAREHLSRPSRVLSFLARISYPLYVVHGVGGYVVMRVAIDLGLSPITATLLAIGYAIPTAILLHKLVEEPTRRWAREGRRRMPSAPPQSE